MAGRHSSWVAGGWFITTMVNIAQIPAMSALLSEHPLAVIDVGAAGGIQSMWRRPGLENHVRYFGFEPNPANFSSLREDRVTKYFQLAISDQPGSHPFHACGTVSSLVERDDRVASFADQFETIQVTVETLENLRDANTLPRLDVIKTDAERHDYFVVKGASKYLAAEVLCVTCEVEYSGKRKGSRARDIDELLTPNGFLLFGMQHKLGALGELFGGDVLYLRDVGSILTSDADAAVKRERLLKLGAICLILNHHTYAHVVAQAGEESGVLSAPEADSLRNAIARHVFLPFAVPFRSRALRLAHGFSVMAQIASGPKWSSKAAPRPGSLRAYRQLSVDGAYVPRSWRQRYEQRLAEAFQRYKRLRGIFYE